MSVLTESCAFASGSMCMSFGVFANELSTAALSVDGKALMQSDEQTPQWSKTFVGALSMAAFNVWYTRADPSG